MVCYEGGYAVDTVFDCSKLGIEPQAVQITPAVFDGSKLGIEPYAVEVTPAGDLLALDPINSNIYRVQLPLSPFVLSKLQEEGLKFETDNGYVLLPLNPIEGEHRNVTLDSWEHDASLLRKFRICDEKIILLPSASCSSNHYAVV